MKKNLAPVASSFALISASLALFACAPPGPTGPEKAAAYHANEAAIAEEKAHPTPPTEAEITLQFPMCVDKKIPPFPPETAGAAFRAIVFYRITEDGKTKEHCYLAVDGDVKWEERALDDVNSWSYEPKFAGEPRERVVTYRLK